MTSLELNDPSDRPHNSGTRVPAMRVVAYSSSDSLPDSQGAATPATVGA